MKVRRVVEMLYQTYDPEQEIMAVWIGSEGFETKAGVWQRAVELFEKDNYIDNDFIDAVRNLVWDADAEIEQEESEKLHASLAIDSYLERVREEQANV
jgi:hypothetical protein